MAARNASPAPDPRPSRHAVEQMLEFDETKDVRKLKHLIAMIESLRQVHDPCFPFEHT